MATRVLIFNVKKNNTNKELYKKVFSYLKKVSIIKKKIITFFIIKQN